tara:strand:+ start:883 stop:1833 length:951 start_codon:yes stop_codon:yes gene_type:complete
MKLQTQIPLQAVTSHQIDYNSNVLLFGSCFSEHIGAKFSNLKFKSESNPFGILFHVKAIENLIKRSLNETVYEATEVFQLNEQFQCFDTHSKLNGLTETDLLRTLNSALKQTKNSLGNATHVIITLGTAWVYAQKDTKKIVANCHKVPQKEFEKQLLSIDDISHSLKNIITLIKRDNPEVQFIFTVSPVRHIKDGFVENTLSKAYLISAIHQILKDDHQAHYFPSYEIVMDELRDYRFYNDDMLHPNTTAVNYIWKRFSETWMSTKTLQLLKRVEQLHTGLNHKPFNPNSEAHKNFQQQLKEQQLELKKEISHLIF